MKRADFRTLLDRELLVCDGGMGSQIYERLGHVRSVEEVSLTQPETVFRIHLDYIRAGARMIETNTFGANRWKLGPLGLAGQLTPLNHAAVKIAREAREAAGAQVLIAGSLGPLGRTWWLEEVDAAALAEQARAVFREQAAALEERGVDLFILETFPALQELIWAVEAVRSFSQLPVVAQLAYNDEGRTLLGDEAVEASRRLLELEVDAVGANCGIGPQDMLNVLRLLSELNGARLSVQPNVGMPRRMGDRIIYPKATPEYFADFARQAAGLRAAILGGCCGTTPEHIRAIAQAVKPLKPGAKPAAAARVQPSVHAVPEVPREAAAEPDSGFYRKLRAGRFVVSVELDPPKGVNLERIHEAVERLRASGAVDAVDINSGTLARLGMDAIMLAVAIEHAGLETIPHLTTRDLNVIGLQAMLLGAWSVGGVRNVLAITGDPPSLGDHPQVTGIYEVDAVGLVRIIHRLNQGYDWAGKTLGGATNFAIGVALNPTADDLDEEIRRFRLKLEAGAHFAMTQPLFDPAQWERFLDRLGGPPPVPVLIGIWPLTSLQLAQRLNNEVPGIVIPEPVLKRLEAAGPRARDEGFALARELFAWTKSASASGIRGAYLIPPFKKYEEALEVIAP
ncbi:MAG TPA: bifunctional homocysteine S-methyltransferase/methylenetetrahydrofolate reductase [Candidatus Acidoferrales bacterium]|nr:bifunctional homocysteine S-methyltransferase/methylenetetrahydrofolate reductase [Candidatus Acidoferrales bacterium]